MTEELLETAMLHLKAELSRNGYKEKTIERYILHNSAFLRFLKKKPHYVRKEDIDEYLNLLSSDPSIKKSIIMEIREALDLFYEQVLKKDFYIKEPEKENRQILSREEIKTLIDSSPSIKHKLFLKLLYSTGMRLSECVKLTKEDIDLKNMKIKNKYPIHESIIPDFGIYLDSRKDSNPYLFNANEDSHISPKTAQKYIDLATDRAGMQRIFYPEIIASFAKHLSESKGHLSSLYYKLYVSSNIKSPYNFIDMTLNNLKENQHPLDTF